MKGYPLQKKFETFFHKNFSILEMRSFLQESSSSTRYYVEKESLFQALY